MADNKEAQKERADKRKTQVDLLKDEGMANLYIAAAGLDSGRYGAAARSATISFNYVPGMASGTPFVGKFLGNAYAQQASEAVNNGQDPYEMAGPVPTVLLRDARKFYESGWDLIYVDDVLKLLEIKGVSQKNISPEQRKMTMGEFAEANKELYQDLTSLYFSRVAQGGIGRSLIAQKELEVKGLEKRLQTPLEEDKK